MDWREELRNNEILVKVDPLYFPKEIAMQHGNWIVGLFLVGFWY
jgi:hypothetical protein